jgi:predicted kinase
LVLTGGPAAGKSTTARRLAQTRPRAALIDVDDIRQLIVSGAAAPWEGDEGRRQQHLGVENACGLAAGSSTPTSMS